MSITKLYASKNSYGNTRDKNTVKAIVIHNTGNKGDTAKNNALYFRNTNTRLAGAHLFIDRSGEIYKSVPYGKTAYSVGGAKWHNDGGQYYGVYGNSNTVSIELCDIVDKYPSKEQIAALKKAIKNVRKKCPNAKKVIRHYDVNGKTCPLYFVDDKRWNKLLKAIGEK